MNFNNFRFLIHFIFYVGVFCANTTTAWSQEELAGDFVFVEKNSISYWEKDAYKSYTFDTTTVSSDNFAEKFQSIQKKYNGSEFEYDERKIADISFFDRLKRWLDDFFNSLLPDVDVGNVYDIILYTFIGLAVVAILFTLYRLIFGKNSVFQREKREKEDSEIAFVERNLETIDITHYIQQAENNQQWNLAVRYLHLQNIQRLAHKNIVEWNYRKTNHDFLAEIKDNALKAGFNETATLFNYIWFGDFKINQADYERFKTDFILFKNLIS